ncbi:serine/threonine-protein kinase mos [Halyomorpha halys]|uniref:serine/threonine-protein kinase mos n=1 Tax=Halyomorpha halys TaxID=286706 RepID=UPI0006D528E3|nr:serine/threonine-protein kinase mos [Halyomorpha halys]
MASPIIQQLKKSLSPRSPIMRFKSPFKVKQGECKLSVPTSDSEYINLKVHFQGVSPCRRQLFKDGASFNNSKVPKMCNPLSFEPGIKDILDNGIDEKEYYVLGKGTFGTVILSCLRGEKAAVKVVKMTIDQSTINRERNALILSHKNVIDVRQVIFNPSKKYGIVVMEAWSPLTLQAVNEEAIQISTEDSIRIMIGISKALEYCHEVDIVHLDVKPKNILLDLKAMQSKLCDFGNSYNMKNPIALKNIQGTVAYLAPEVFQGKKVTDKCDVYSFGITLWQILHKENPYNGLEQHIIIYQVVANKERPKTLCKCETKGYVKLYEKCWNEEPTQRPPMSSVTNNLQLMI